MFPNKSSLPESHGSLDLKTVQIKPDQDLTSNPSLEKYNFITTTNIFSKPDTVKNILHSLVKDGFLLVLEDAQSAPSEDDLEAFNCKLIAKFDTEKAVCLLVRKVSRQFRSCACAGIRYGVQ